ncbi:hypothetical protein [Bifidobacterium lemurum]|nr:hypothetical protein [Bifidobacterium lemurum]
MSEQRDTQDARETFDVPDRYGTGVDWNEFHTHIPYTDATE